MNSKRSLSRKIQNLAPAILISILAFLSLTCEKSKEIAKPETPAPYGKLVGYSDCKSFDDEAKRLDSAPNLDCIEWNYTAEGQLYLKHTNAGFNCCPEELYAEITITADTITIEEYERGSLCHCLCLYDLDYTISNLEPGTYTIRVEEPYRQQTDPVLEITVDLSSAPMGSFCVKRSGYPWNDGSSNEPQGRIVRVEGCGRSNTDPALYPGDLSCIEWNSAGETLLLKHLNATFNCCAKIGADIKISDTIIAITEWESNSVCDCHCLFDVEYEITNLLPGTYRIIFTEPYRRSDEEALEFTVDLVTFPMGVQCAYRDHYPWGFLSTLKEDEARLDDMKRAIMDFVGTPYCSDDRQCRYIGIGRKPCGGPWSYLIYSASSVDEYELRYRVLRYNAWNHGMNRRHNLVSTCDIPPVPNPRCFAGVCKENSGKED